MNFLISIVSDKNEFFNREKFYIIFEIIYIIHTFIYETFRTAPLFHFSAITITFNTYPKDSIAAQKLWVAVQMIRYATPKMFPTLKEVIYSAENCFLFNVKIK